MPAYRNVKATQVLEAIERWAGREYWVERETGIVLDGGRLDALLAPVTFEASRCGRGGKYGAFGLYGIEVKVSRSDFMNGLKNGQYERYRDAPALAGLYVATPKGLAKTSELPKGVGHLTINTEKSWSSSGWVAVCRRKPANSQRETPSSALWRVIERMAFRHRQEIFEIMRAEKDRDREIGQTFGAEVGAVVRKYRRMLDAK